MFLFSFVAIMILILIKYCNLSHDFHNLNACIKQAAILYLLCVDINIRPTLTFLAVSHAFEYFAEATTYFAKKERLDAN